MAGFFKKLFGIDSDKSAANSTSDNAQKFEPTPEIKEVVQKLIDLEREQNLDKLAEITYSEHNLKLLKAKYRVYFAEDNLATAIFEHQGEAALEAYVDGDVIHPQYDEIINRVVNEPSDKDSIDSLICNQDSKGLIEFFTDRTDGILHQVAGKWYLSAPYECTNELLDQLKIVEQELKRMLDLAADPSTDFNKLRLNAYRKGFPKTEVY